MKLAIFTPGHPSPRRKSYPPALTAPYLAALAAPYAEKIKICDLGVEEHDASGSPPDLALFTTTMAQSDYMFEIARAMKSKGATVMLGGPHATLAYDFDPRIKEIFDSVVLGEGEKALPQALKDFGNGALQHTYAIPVNSLDAIPFSRLDLLDHQKYMTSTVVFGTRGCIHKCAYCSIRGIYGYKYLKRPVEEVIAEIKFQTERNNLRWVDRKLIQFWDDNPAGDLDWFHNLLERLIPLKKWWTSQMCLNVADSPETLKLMKASGCKGIFVGFESISKDVIVSQKKDAINVVAMYKKQCQQFLKHGINVVGAIMFGFDEDTKESLFKETFDLLEDIGLSVLNPLLFTPYPHLDVYKTLKKEDRILTDQAKYYNGYTVVHRPRHIHPAELQEGLYRFRQRFYSWRSIIKRLLKHRVIKYPEILVGNLIWRTMNTEAIPGVDVEEWKQYLRSL